jgi:hypothetical protein
LARVNSTPTPLQRRSSPAVAGHLDRRSKLPSTESYRSPHEQLKSLGVSGHAILVA